MALLQPFDQRHNIAVRHLFRLNVSLAFPGLFHLSHGGTGRCRRRLLLSNGCSVDHWALVTALTPFWRCRESDQRCFTPRPSGGPLVMDPLVLPITGLVLVVAQIIYGDTPQSHG